MATRKQRRRRAKDKRHDYEVVYLDSEGNEVEPEEVESAGSAKAPARAASGSKQPASKSSRLFREPKPPSWSRAARRGAIFVAILIGFLVLTQRSRTTPAGIVLDVIVVAVLVVPLGYYTDRFTWRGYQRRLTARSAGKPSGRSGKR